MFGNVLSYYLRTTPIKFNLCLNKMTLIFSELLNGWLDIKNKKSHYGAFIIPHSDKGQIQNHGVREKIFIDDAIEGLFSQTDDDWCAIVVVNASPGKKVTEYLNA